MLITFVILHYITIEDTIKCTDLIQKYAKKYQCRIIIIDNASPNKNGKQLADAFSDKSNIDIVILKKNIGFAKGNNIGYEMAKRKYHSDFVVILNNDVEIHQDSFIPTIFELYQSEKFHILGPDIITLEGKHQNPHRKEVFSTKRVKQLIRNRTIIRIYLEIKKFFHLEEKIMILEKMDAQNAMREGRNIDSKKRQEGVVLQGSCYIFSPLYLQENEFAFYPDTFMYLEEEILCYLCKLKKYKVLYSPKLKVIHKEASSTKQSMTKFNQSLFCTIHLKESAKILYRLMKNESARNM